MIPYSCQFINNKDIKSVIKVLKSKFLTQGPMVEIFEKKLKKYACAKYATAVSSATAALHISCLALNLKKEDFLWTSPISFVASANCALYCGAKVDFIDIDPDTFNISIDSLKLKLKKAKQLNKLPKIIVPVHLAGSSCDMKQIYELSKKYKFKIIEDASHALGGKYLSQKVGSCQYSDLTILSFHPTKIITTGEGGAVLSNDKRVDAKIKILRTSGINKNLNKKKLQSKGPWYYEQSLLGYNYRMNDISAALGVSQIDKIDFFVKKRNLIAKKYKDKLANLPIKFQKILLNNYSSHHLFIIRVPAKKRKIIFNQLRSSKIFANIHYIPIYLQPYYRGLGFKKNMCPEAENYYSEAISIPVFPKLSSSAQNRVISIVKKNLLN
jgi:UDP-4-amino-4,6-dideoxy-N-acetyl-beta-L-altrosamine transaminase